MSKAGAGMAAKDKKADEGRPGRELLRVRKILGVDWEKKRVGDGP